MFMKPDTEPENDPPMSALTDQKELCDKYKAPAPPANTTLARRALSTLEPNARKTAASAIANAATPHLPTRRPALRVSMSLRTPPSGHEIAIARKKSASRDVPSCRPRGKETGRSPRQPRRKSNRLQRPAPVSGSIETRIDWKRGT